MEQVAAADRLVLLGDVLELRHGPARVAMAAARPFFEDLARALGDGEVIICQGNHDYALVAPWLARRSEIQGQPPLAVEQRLDPSEASPALATMREWLKPASVVVAYPGVWLRDDVYATHGHYLDCHVTIPTLERLGIGAMCRVVGRSSESLVSVEDYELVSAPLFAWLDAVARQGPTGPALNGSITVRVWHALGGGDSTHSGLRSDASRSFVRTRLARLAPAVRWRLLAQAFPLVVAALNRAGMGPLRSEISRDELRRAGLRAMGEVAAGLDLGDAYVIFGHIHRVGPLSGDAEQEWQGRLGARLMNTGCWTYERAFLSSSGADTNPYWPGGCVVVEDSGPPQVMRLLSHLTRKELLAAMD